MKNTIKFIVTASGSKGLDIIFQIHELLKKISETFRCETSITLSTAGMFEIGFSNKFSEINKRLNIDNLKEVVENLNELIETSAPINFDIMDKVQLREFAKGAGFTIANNRNEEYIREFLKNNFPKKQK
jgi:hypothetical protein